MKRGEILDAVKQTITKDRNNRHGEPENSFPRIAEEWADYLRRRGWTISEDDLKPSDVAEMLAIFKGVRFEIQPDNPDNEHDRIGYYAIAAELRAVERDMNRPVPMPAQPQAKPATPVEFPPYEPKSHGELSFYKNNEFIAYNSIPKGGLIWTLVGPYN